MKNGTAAVLAPASADQRQPATPFGRFYSGLARLVESAGAENSRRRALGLVDAISHRLHCIAAERASRTDLHATDLQVLILLALAGRDRVLRASELQHALGFTAGGVTRRLDTMDAKGLVERLPDPADGRAWLVRLTDRGGAIVEASLAENRPRNRRIEGEFSADEWDTLLTLLGRLLAAVD